MLLLVLSACLAASGRPVSFAQAREIAERGSPDLRVAQRRVDVSRAEVAVAGTLANPTLTVTTALQTAKVGSTLSVPLPLFGQRGRATDAAEADLAAVQIDTEVARDEARWNASGAWVDLWAAQEKARLLALAAEDAQRLWSVATERFAAGSGPRLDVVRALGDRARAQAEATSARAGIRSAMAKLLPWLGESPDAELAAVGAPGFSATLPPLPQLLEETSQHPVMKRDRAQAEAADAHVRLEQRLRWPILNGQVTVNYGDPTLAGTDVIGGVSLDLPLLNWRGGAIARAQAQRAVSEATLDLDLRRVLSDLRDAYRRAEGAAARVQAFEKDVLPAAEEARAMTEEGYRAGRVDLLRLIDAQRSELEARQAQLDGQSSLHHALADLEKATGRRLDEEKANGR